MKKVFKIFLPVITGFLPLWIFYEIYFLINPIDPQVVGDGAMRSLFVFEYIFFPAILWVMILVQMILLRPLWDMAIKSLKKTQLIISISLAIFCILMGILIGYAIWYPTNGFKDLLIQCYIWCTALFIYFGMNLTTLYFLDKSLILELNA